MVVFYKLGNNNTVTTDIIDHEPDIGVHAHMEKHGYIASYIDDKLLFHSTNTISFESMKIIDEFCKNQRTKHSKITFPIEAVLKNQKVAKDKSTGKVFSSRLNAVSTTFYSISFSYHPQIRSFKRCVLANCNIGDNNPPSKTLVSADCSHANFHRCIIQNIDIQDTNFIGTKNLWYGPNASRIINVQNADRALFSLIHVARRKWPGGIRGLFFKYLPTMRWSMIRSIGAFHLVAASYAAVSIAIIYSISARWYNQQLLSAQQIINSQQAETKINIASQSYDTFLTILSQLGPAPLPLHLALQIVFGLILVVGTTIYAFKCPSIVKAYSADQWELEQKQELLIYRAADYSKPVWRWIAAICFFAGLPAWLLYLLMRGIESAAYLWSDHTIGEAIRSYIPF